ncbi:MULTISPECIES: hypothetical protein [unclassified Synechococcus]|uniref:hypothetical protein n=1 Tax=unclassified Synechococcus TaxID=2626047 RepID=UPI0006527CFA|nr:MULTISPECIES: hypothetical protein [unclassified Synechococcus]AKN62331.1 hypothetical protein WB44_09375 [Synechococcus sp. WH 8020]
MSNAAALYARIENDQNLSKGLFRQALQNPSGALDSICEIGTQLNLPVTLQEVKEHINNLDDEITKQWLIKARGGL